LVLVAFFAVLQQTLIVVQERFSSFLNHDDSYSYFYNFIYFLAISIWTILLTIHSVFFLFGISVSHKYYDKLASSSINAPDFVISILNNLESNEYTDDDNEIKVFDIGRFSYYSHMLVFIMPIYLFKFSDIILFSIWNLFFHWNRQELKFLFRRTGGYGFDLLLEWYSTALFIICFAQLSIALPFTYLILFSVVTILLDNNFRNRNNTFRDVVKGMFQLKELIIVFYIFNALFLLNPLHKFLYDTDYYSWSTTTFFQLIHCLMIYYFERCKLHFPSPSHFVKTLYGNNFTETYLGKYIINLLPSFRIRFFQFFFLFYCFKILYYH
jgi:hypothetical protein